MFGDKICFWPLAAQGSKPNIRFLSLAIRQVRPSPMTSKDLVPTFHKIEILAYLLEGDQIHSSRDAGAIYFCSTANVQRLLVVNSLHTHFAANAFENRKMFFDPQPPRGFRIAILSHLIHGMTKWSLWPLQRNLKHNCLAFSKIPFLIQAREIQ